MDPKYESLDSIADHTAHLLVEAASGAAFALFREKQFRRLARFETIGQVEHDLFKRILLDLSRFYVMLRVRLEGRKVGFFTRVHARLRSWLR